MAIHKSLSKRSFIYFSIRPCIGSKIAFFYSINKSSFIFGSILVIFNALAMRSVINPLTLISKFSISRHKFTLTLKQPKFKSSPLIRPITHNKNPIITFRIPTNKPSLIILTSTKISFTISFRLTFFPLTLIINLNTSNKK